MLVSVAVMTMEYKPAVALAAPLGASHSERFEPKDDAVIFELHPRLAADCIVLGDLKLCRVLLNNDARFPWCILVPRVPALRDFHEVPDAHRAALFAEIEHVSLALQHVGQADKMNVAALGNMVPQLHIHVIARRTDDAAWPTPVWSAGAAEPYSDPEPMIAQLTARLDLE
jgi:diadenosine tetraphosphate (Ap4A) HIT family hydrolase